MTAGNSLVSIAIATRNRKQEVLSALESCFAQTYRPLEVLVFDDASTDGTGDAVRKLFPDVRYVREEVNRGISALRNRGLREARGEFVFSIDDDAYYTDRGTVGRVVDHFRREPDAAVIAMPFVEPLRPAPPASRLQRGARLRTFTSCAYAIRRGVAIELQGYREFFFYRGEERDLSIRLLDRGFSIVYGDSSPVVHLYSPKRAWSQMFPFGIRSNLLFDWLNIPQPYVLPRLIIDAVQLALYRITPGQIPARLADIARGFFACAQYSRERSPVARRTYRLYRSLPGHGPVTHAGDIPSPASNSSRID